MGVSDTPASSDAAKPAPDSARAFFEAYADALTRLDIDALVAVYRLPLPVVRPDRTRVVEQEETLRAEIGRILDFYRWSGMARVEIGAFSVEGFAIGMDVVSLTWLPLRDDGAEIARIDATFALRRTREGGRIAAVIAHNEEHHRQPILREAMADKEIDRERILRPLP
jgi:hypothetical protein